MPAWFLILWVMVLVTAIWTKSLVANLAFMFACVLGFKFALDLAVLPVIQWGVAGMFVLAIAFSALEIVTNVERF